ncbi:UrcA family protein [Sphingobium sp.]|uniref:UrcA family protein n=1 Tax=Sphingobium sp. TaxID=1912891 RepID=UPI002C79EA50|nr:UrcA family protein [Sphingobium sp.]HUD91906.1 UrcA family protein [Sphingobium sp.]
MNAAKLFLSLAIGMATPAVGSAEAIPGVVVPSSDLDLSRTEDIRRLKARISVTIRKICAQPDNSALALHSERLCRRSATVGMTPPSYPRM